MEGIIYCYTNKTNGKCYIGLTTREGRRKVEHLRDSLVKNSSRPFHCAIRKYGIDAFEYTVLERISNDDKDQLMKTLSELETSYINEFDSYNNGYNNTLGSDGARGARHSDEERLAKSIRQGRPVMKYALDGTFIEEYASSGIAASSIISKSKWACIAGHISDCCNGRSKTAYGFKWSYKH